VGNLNVTAKFQTTMVDTAAIMQSFAAVIDLAVEKGFTSVSVEIAPPPPPPPPK
jgi:hypothetical protein